MNVCDLKAEAVKWVKEMQKDNGIHGDCDLCGGSHKTDYHKAEALINFFNLTEEDLK